MTYAELLVAVQDWVENRDSVFVTHIPRFVQNAERRIYARVQPPAVQAYVTGNLTNGVALLTKPAGLLSVFEFSVTSSGTAVFLLQKDVSFLTEAYPAATTGVPKYYAEYSATQLLLAPTPASTYAYSIGFYKMPDSIVTASTSWLGDNQEQLLLYATLVEAAVFMKEEADVIERYDGLYARALEDFEQHGDRRMRQDAYRNGKAKAKLAPSKEQ